MINVNYNDFPIIVDFKKLKLGQYVCSKKFGLGVVERFYNEGVIINFDGYSRRIEQDDKELREYQEIKKAKSPKAKFEVDGQYISLRDLKKANKLKAQFTKLLTSD